MINITLKDGNTIQIESGLSVSVVAALISENLARVAICAKVGDRFVDLNHKLTQDTTLRIYTLKDPEGQLALRHTAAHVMAAAVKNIFPTAKLGVSHETMRDDHINSRHMFSYDFDFATPIKSEDLSKIEIEMDRIIKLDFPVTSSNKSRAEATRMLDANKEVYKIDILNQIPRGEKITFYKIDKFSDLCGGPHLPNVNKIKAFKLTQITGAYWRADSKNKMLTRIYGVAFDKANDLETYTTTQEEIKRRDHNKIGRDLELFTTVDCVGQGLPILLPNGAKIVQILQRFVEDEEERRGYLRVMTPDFAKSDMYKISGHWQHYKDNMFIIGNEVLDEEIFALKPMTCPFHFFSFRNSIRSYRDLPIKYAETAKQYRSESSGEMHGLIRVRQYTLSDGHIICRPDQVQTIFRECIDLSNFLLKAIGINDITYRLSKWDPKNKEKYIDNPQAWESSQAEIRKVLTSNKLKFVESDGDAAFYGPKIDIQYRNVYGKEDTLVTMQLDFANAERFDLTYVDENGEKVRPFIVHRSSIGSYERTLAMLIEKHAGAFPVWLSPLQAIIIGISNKQDAYVDEVLTKISHKGIRIQKDIRNEKVGYKIREYTLKKIPFMLVVGEKEQAENTVSVRTREGEDLGTMSIEDFISRVETLRKEFK